MGIDSAFWWRGGSGGEIVLFELFDGHITQEFVTEICPSRRVGHFKAPC